MASRNLADLLPAVHEAANKALSRLEAWGIAFVVSCTSRTIEEQEAEYYQGRYPLSDVNYVRKMAKMTPITEAENRIVTRARGPAAPHVRKIALDIYPLEGGKLAHETSPLWKEIQKAFEAEGFASGIMVKNKKGKMVRTDLPHQQYHGQI